MSTETEAHRPSPPRAVVDESLECEREPIRIPGSVQSHGVLIALRISDLTILQCSENVRDMLGVHPDELLHQPLSKLMAVDVIERAKDRIAERQPRILNPLPIAIRVGTKVRHFDGILHRSGRLLILELEAHVRTDVNAGIGGLYETLRGVITKIIDSSTLDLTFRIACNELRNLTNFSRVLIYRFDDTWDGQVVAESIAPGEETLAAHRFPAGDIPKQARELYTTNWLRIIPDINYQPSPLVPVINPITDAPTDLSNSVLRSVSPVHIEYMRNMGVQASMSVSLLKDGKLWGLIACHHRTPLFLPFEVRVCAEFLGQIVSSQISARGEVHARDEREFLTSFLEELLRVGGSYRSVIPAIKFNPSIPLGIVDAQGLAVITADGIDAVGLVPSPDEIKILNAHLPHHLIEVTSTNRALDTYALPHAVPNAAGVLAFDVGCADTMRLLFFRPERVEPVLWSGNPNEAKERDADGRIRPRKSFASWVETVRDTSLPWKTAEVKAAAELKRVLESMCPTAQAHVATSPRLASIVENALVRTPAARAEDTRRAKNDVRPTDLSTFPDLAMITIDTSGRVLQWSDGARQLMGYTLEEAHHQPLDFLFAEEDRLLAMPKKLLEEALRARKYTHETWLYRADHSSFWAKLRLARVLSPDRSVPYYSLVIEDITKEKSSQEELKATKVAAEAANVAKTSFLANISHEIRTPLGAVLGFAELLGKYEHGPDDRARLYQRIASNGSQLLTLINDLLDLTKVESNKLEIENLNFDLSTFLIDLFDTFELKANEKGVNFEIRLVDALPRFISSDPTRLRQVLVNLLSNAIKFTESGGKVTLRVSSDCSRGRSRLEFRVIDTGRGMSEQEMSKLFQPFVQADISTTRKYGGTGLGIFVSQRIARLLGGDLSIEASRLDHGSTFLAWIEIAVASEHEGAVFTKLDDSFVAIAHATTGPTLSGLRLLVVDDSADNRDLIGVFLENAGAGVAFATNGREALDIYSPAAFDLILMDIQMPVMDGPSAATELLRRGCKAPIVALTAHALAEERNAVMDIGFAAYVTKPIDWAVLINTIKRLVKWRADV